jgi:hypothetical protein
MKTDWTPAMHAWLAEVTSRMEPLTVRQLDIIRPLARKVAVADRTAGNDRVAA